MSRRIYATMISGAAKPQADPGDLVLVELPANCALFGEDAQLLQRLYTIAMTIGQHWRDQEGVNGALMDELASVVATLKPPTGEPHDYIGDGPDCAICGEGWMHYLHDEDRRRQEAAGGAEGDAESAFRNG